MSNLRWDCSKQGCYCESLPDWSIFNDLLPRGIRFTDIDGEVEVGGRFLRIEWKRPRAAVPNGQTYAFEALARRGDTVLVVWGDTAPMRPTHWQIFDGDGTTGRIPVTLRQLQEFVEAWGQAADWRKAA